MSDGSAAWYHGRSAENAPSGRAPASPPEGAIFGRLTATGSKLRERIAAAGALAAASAVAWAAVSTLAPPPPLASDAPPDAFSARRAHRHVERLAAEPRPVGAAAHRRAREYLLEELAALGFEPQLQERTVVRRIAPERFLAARIVNVLARLPGVDSSGALALVAHYDTRAQTFGAGDDASGVAAILEALRALASGPRLANDLVVLFTDAEELGLLGARAFVEHHPWFEDVAAVLNFEARGSRGAAMMFETGPGSSALVAALASSAPAPIASSLSTEVYRRMPNDTDFTPFREAGVAGLNFAFLDGVSAYHTRLDTAERLSLASLQHLGSYALALTRRLGDADLDARSAEESVYFNPLGSTLVVYQRRWVLPLAAAAVVLTLAALGAAFARRRVSASGLALGVGAFAAAAVAGGLAGGLLHYLLTGVGRGLLRGPHGAPYEAGALTLGLALLAAAAVALVYHLAALRASAVALAAGGLLGWTLVAVAVSRLVPGASFLFVWPAMAGALGLLLAARGGRGEELAAAGLAALALAPAVAAALFAPLVRLVVLALPLRMLAAPAALAALALTPLAALLGLLGGKGRLRVAGTLAAAAVAVLAAGVLRSGYDAGRPAVDHLLYALDADSGEASWLTPDDAVDGWTARWLGGEPRSVEPPRVLSIGDAALSAPAEPLELPPPRAELVSDSREEGRRVELRALSPRGAQVLRMDVETSVPIRAVTIEGERFELGGGDLETGAEGPLEVRIAYYGLPAEGARVAIELPDAWPLELRLADQTFELPPPPPGASAERPPHLIPGTSWRTDSTFVLASTLL